MTKAKSNVMSDFGLPIIVLVLICAIMSGLLAVTNDITAPIIEEAERKANEEARMEVMPAETSGFTEVDTQGIPSVPATETGGIPESITGIYAANGGAGYTFSITTQGYGGKGTLKMAVGIGMDGKLTGVKILSHKETAGLGSKITTDEGFYGQFPGLDAAGAAAADTISGATFSSKYYKAAIADAFTAYSMVSGDGGVLFDEDSAFNVDNG